MYLGPLSSVVFSVVTKNYRLAEQGEARGGVRPLRLQLHPGPSSPLPGGRSLRRPLAGAPEQRRRALRGKRRGERGRDGLRARTQPRTSPIPAPDPAAALGPPLPLQGASALIREPEESIAFR